MDSKKTRKEQILEFLRQNPDSRIKEIAKYCEKKYAVIQSYVSKLTADGVLRRTGYGRYAISSQVNSPFHPGVLTNETPKDDLEVLQNLKQIKRQVGADKFRLMIKLLE